MKKNLKIEVDWYGNPDDDYSKYCAELFAESIRGYIEMFDSIPLKGMYISNGECDSGKIDKIVFDGIGCSLWVCLDFDTD